MAYGYYPGCSLHSTAKEYNISLKAVCGKLGIELSEVEDWNCCGATPAHTTKEELGVALAYNNLLNASRQGLEDILAPCAACYNRLKNASYAVKHSPEVNKRMNELTGGVMERDMKVYNILEFFRDIYGQDNLKAAIEKPLEGLNVACYYGCLLVRPSKVLNFDDAEDPVSMDDLVRLIGGNPVRWSCKTECCGGSHAIPETDIVLELGRRIFTSAQAGGAEMIAVACPLCQANLDMRQSQINKKFNTDFRMPVVYVTQLIGLALGLSKEELGFNSHFVSAAELLKK
ncbi:MAG: heterodisulfide reductase subunit B [Ignavibacteria bacterium]|jgi:heterodisulfide reductase subunit B|nr:heterodisulfide reductase subunit B [Ignavibacteria bacterium]MCU7503495.1 heterodisulfide reductase subunit B [Ignavibacteria bacterium]MCU7516173.1 heterodisulfide reductase subunit B [Ignavibacteria bacterium]